MLLGAGREKFQTFGRCRRLGSGQGTSQSESSDEEAREGRGRGQNLKKSAVPCKTPCSATAPETWLNPQGYFSCFRFTSRMSVFAPVTFSILINLDGCQRICSQLHRLYAALFIPNNKYKFKLTANVSLNLIYPKFDTGNFSTARLLCDRDSVIKNSLVTNGVHTSKRGWL